MDELNNLQATLLECRYNLKKKNIVGEDACPICGVEVETSNHLILDCSFAKEIWASLNVDTTGHDVATLWVLPRPSLIPAAHYNTFLLMVSWFLWIHRNAVAFNSLPPSRARVKSALLDAAPIWRHRLPAGSAVVVDSWCSLFSSNM
ncbi:hypothetical protein BS78_03G000800 [Paspalum vaginatum]|nr:hypothetical protein BS78_03G000800 [Paspalum vaginatum]